MKVAAGVLGGGATLRNCGDSGGVFSESGRAMSWLAVARVGGCGEWRRNAAAVWKHCGGEHGGGAARLSGGGGDGGGRAVMARGGVAMVRR